MKVKLKSVPIFLAWIIGVLLLLWMLVWGYVILNKKSLIRQVNEELNRRVEGDIKIGDLEPSLLSTFPNISLKLSSVFFRDSLWSQHHHDLLKADYMIVRLKLFSLFSGSPEISKLIVHNGSLYLFSDSTGYSNEYLLKSQKSSGGSKQSASGTSIPDIELDNVRFVLSFPDRSKFYDIDVRRLRCNIKNRDSILQLDVRTNMLVHNLAFNTDNGSFAKEKPLSGNFRLHFDMIRKVLNFENIRLEIDDHPFIFSGKFEFEGKPPLYYLTVSTEKVLYRQASALLSQNISSKLDSFGIEKPIDAKAVIDGTNRPNDIPRVDIQVNINSTRITLPFAEIDSASLVAHFNNHQDPLQGPFDKNSGFLFTGFTGKLEEIRLRSDTVRIDNLDHPVLDCDIHAGFKVNALNDLLGTSSINFTNGNCEADLKYKGLVVEGDTAGASIFGAIKFRNSGILYIPRNLMLSNCSGNIVFEDKDVFVRQMNAQIANSSLIMNGGVRNLMSLIDKNPDKLVLDWTIASPRLNLNDFTSFLGSRASGGSKKAAKKRFIKLANRIDRLLQDCSVQLQLNANKLTYKKFDASNVSANLRLTNKDISLKNMQVQHAGGTIAMSGSMSEGSSFNNIRFKSIMDNVDIAKVFTAFNNFGQDGITDKNLKGRLSATIDITGAINRKAEIVSNSLRGVIDLGVKNGELNNFEPVAKISQTAFKSRDFSNIRFAELKEKLLVNGSEIRVNRMEIQSTVMTMFVEGIYDIKKGTDLSIQIPLKNLAKRGDDFELKNKGVNSKTGVSLRLRAKTGEDGKAKISWDPFRISLKKNPKQGTDSLRVNRADSNRKKSH